ncbi:MAG: hypothetical protein ABH836_02285 [Candidatus Omnitrophota bacterium]
MPLVDLPLDAAPIDLIDLYMNGTAQRPSPTAKEKEYKYCYW